MGKVQELTVTLDDSFQPTTLPRIAYPSIDGNTLVGVIETGDDTHAVIAIDLTSGKMQILFEGQEHSREPQISGDYVVWESLYQVFLYDLDSEQLRQLSSSGVARHARISENLVVWEQIPDLRSAEQDIWGYDLTQRQEFSAVIRPDAQSGPLVSSQWIVYQGSTDIIQSGNWDVGLYATDLDTEETIRLGQVNSPQTYIPSLYTLDAPWVAWSSGHWNTRPELYLYNLNTRTPYTVTAEPCAIDGEQRRLEDLALSGSTLVFVCGQRMGYDIEQSVFFSLPIRSSAITKGYFTGWDISGDRLVWVLTEDAFGPQEQSHIYTAQIERDP